MTSLHFLRGVAGVIHCDLKPENILFTSEKSDQVKIIDFGSSCFHYKSGFTYVQSRYYRAPEILLGLPYDQGVDMWSFGCIIAELYTGRPLFPAIDENELLEFFTLIIGKTPQQMIQNAKKRYKFFHRDDQIIPSPKSRLARSNQTFSLQDALQNTSDKDLLDFLSKCLILDPQ